MLPLRGAWPGLALLLLAGCAVLSPLERPKVSLAGLSLIDANLFEQRYALKLRVLNPNEVALPIQALTYDLELNDQVFGSGASTAAVTVPAYGS